MLLYAPLVGRATVLSGLDDWLIYESSARDILLNGPLMDGGQGHAAPFYGQPLYPYVLALAHKLTGEGLFGPLAVQFAALGLVVAATAVLARRAFGGLVNGLVARRAYWCCCSSRRALQSRAPTVYRDIYMPLVMASLIVMVSWHDGHLPAWWQAAASGVLLGLTVIAVAVPAVCAARIADTGPGVAASGGCSAGVDAGRAVCRDCPGHGAQLGGVGSTGTDLEQRRRQFAGVSSPAARLD
jgi:hypothetical protein